MSQNDFVIANQPAPNFRSDLNAALQALASLSSGATAPTTTYANMLWYDSGNNILKMRTEADDAWINIGTLNQSAGVFEVSNLPTLSESTWETGTDTTEATVSPAKVKAAIDALAPSPNNITLGSLERLNAGNQVRLNYPSGIATTGGQTIIGPVPFIQGGQVTLYATRRDSRVEFIVRRIRAGVTTDILRVDDNLSADVDVIPGDIFSVRVFHDNAPGDTRIDNPSVRTGGADLWPADVLFGLVTGNRALT